MTSPAMGNLSTEQITTFADDSTLVSGAKPGMTAYSSWKTFAEEGRNHGILDVLSRTVLLTDDASMWTTGKTINQYPTEAITNSVFSFPQAIFDKSPNIVKKLSNFAYFRANVKVRIMVNAQPFSQGKLWIWFSPYELASGTQTAADNMYCKTGYPGVELDVASGVPVEFSIPYCAPQSHYCLTTGEGTMGDLFLTVLAPLTVENASLSVIAWFEDIDLQMPTGAEFVSLNDPSFYYSPYTFSSQGYDLQHVKHPAWANVPLPTNNTSKVTTITSLLIETSSKNLVLLPRGTTLTLAIGTLGANTYQYTVTTTTGISGHLILTLGASSLITSGDLVPSNATFVVPYKPLDLPAPLTFALTDGATYSITDFTIPAIATSTIPGNFTTQNYLLSFSNVYDGNKTAIVINSIYNSCVCTRDANGIIITNEDTTSSKLITAAAFDGNDLAFTFANNGTSYYKPIAQSDNSNEDEFYKNYPRAQNSESELQAISGLVTSSMSLAKSISKVPMLSSLVSPLSWMNRLGSLVSSGFSKPTDVEKPHCIYNIPAKGFTHGEGPDNSVMLSCVPDNSIGVVPGVFSSTIDELDVKFIAKKSCFLDSNNWTVNSTGRLVSFFVGPGACRYNNTNYEPTMLAYVASMFKFWHGTIRYRISVAKTGFHSGRLRISYHPGAYIRNTFYPSDSAYSWILDLSVSSEIDIEIPYVSTKPWLVSDVYDYTANNPYGPTNNSDSAIGSNNLNYFSGVLQYEVLNRLRNAGAASATVQIITWISGGDDIEFAVPNFTSFRPCSNLPSGPSAFSQMRFKRDLSEDVPPIIEEDEVDSPIADESQQEDDESLPSVQAFQNVSDAISNSTQLDGSTFTKMFSAPNAFNSANTLTIGEKVTNLRVLLKRFTPTVYKASTTTSASPSEILLDPAYFGALQPTANTYDYPIKIFDNTGNLLGSYSINTSPIEYIAKIYRFYRGSRRYKCVVGNGNTDDPKVQTFSVRAYLGSVLQVNGTVTPPNISAASTLGENPEDNFATSSRFSHFVDGQNNKICEITAPFYSLTPIQVISDGTYLPQRDDYISRYYVYFDPGATFNTNCKEFVVYQAAGDDFNFGYLIGAPRLKRIEAVVDYL